MTDQTKTEPHKIDGRRWLHTEPVKLKDKNNRNTIFYDLGKMYSFRPSFVAITKVRGQHDMVMLSVEMTDEEFEKRTKLAEVLKKKQMEAANAGGTDNPTPGKETT